MVQVQDWLQYLANNPRVAVGIAVVFGLVLFALFRKPKRVREAEARFRKLRDERAGQYNQMRPPR